MERAAIIISLLFLILLFGIGCTGNLLTTEKGTTIATFTSPGILNTNLEVLSAKDEVYTGANIIYPIAFRANITNLGSSATKGIICIEGLSNWYIFEYDRSSGDIIKYFGPLCKEFELDPYLSPYGNPYSDTFQIPKENVYASPPNVPGKTQQEINLEVCYTYKTEVHYMICFNKPGLGGKSCSGNITYKSKAPIEIQEIHNQPTAAIEKINNKLYYVVLLHIRLRNIEPDSVIIDKNVVERNLKENPVACSLEPPEEKSETIDISKILYKINVKVELPTLEGIEHWLSCGNVSIEDYYAQRFSINCYLYLNQNDIEKYFSNAEQVEIPIHIYISYGVLKRKTYYLNLVPIK